MISPVNWQTWPFILMQLASVSGIDLEKAILKKLEINGSRKWDMDKTNIIS